MTPEARQARSEDVYLIWSHEHHAWWGMGEHGYTPRLSRAGRYSHGEAIRIIANAIPGYAQRHGALPELPVRLDDVLTAQAIYRRAFPDRGTEPWE